MDLFSLSFNVGCWPKAVVSGERSHSTRYVCPRTDRLFSCMLLIAGLMLHHYPEIGCSGLPPSPTSKRNQWRENNVVRDLYRRVHYPNHRLGDRSQHAPPASEVDRCGNSLSGRRGDCAWCKGHSTKGSFVLRVFLAPRFAASSADRGKQRKWVAQPQLPWPL